jgi:GMP synthase-like glutamine amidotransferase
MKIALLKCGTPPADLMHIAGDFSQMFFSLFSKVSSEISWQVYDLTKKEYPLSMDEVSGFISTGSGHSVYDDNPWINQYCDFVKNLFKKEKKFIGICFGHQMIAHALGGKTVNSNRGWGVGLKKIKIYKAMKWMEPPLSEYHLLVSHKDQVEILPPQAVLLGGNSHCPKAMFQLQDHFLGIQAHPEFTSAFAKALMHKRAHFIESSIFEKALPTMNYQTHSLEMANWMLNFLKC